MGIGMQSILKVCVANLGDRVRWMIADAYNVRSVHGGRDPDALRRGYAVQLRA